MKLRISVQERVYDVEVDLVENSNCAEEKPTRTGLSIPDPVLRPRAPQRLPEDSVVRSPIAGRVAAILAAPAQKIRRHEGVVLLDAMKMEVPIGPVVDGTLQRVHVVEGEAVATGQILFEMDR